MTFTVLDRGSTVAEGITTLKRARRGAIHTARERGLVEPNAQLEWSHSGDLLVSDWSGTWATGIRVTDNR